MEACSWDPGACLGYLTPPPRSCGLLRASLSLRARDFSSDQTSTLCRGRWPARRCPLHRLCAARRALSRTLTPSLHLSLFPPHALQFLLHASDCMRPSSSKVPPAHCTLVNLRCSFPCLMPSRLPRGKWRELSQTPKTRVLRPPLGFCSCFFRVEHAASTQSVSKRISPSPLPGHVTTTTLVLCRGCFQAAFGFYSLGLWPGDPTTGRDRIGTSSLFWGETPHAHRIPRYLGNICANETAMLIALLGSSPT